MPQLWASRVNYSNIVLGLSFPDPFWQGQLRGFTFHSNFLCFNNFYAAKKEAMLNPELFSRIHLWQKNGQRGGGGGGVISSINEWVAYIIFLYDKHIKYMYI